MIPEMEPLITKAYFLADKLHNGQKRDSGKPYTWHTNKVADLLCLVTNDPTIVAAGYLHDVLEDCEITYAELRQEMGDRVADLVFEVTKKGENCFPNLKSRDAFLIKFADRLQNLSDMVTWNDGRKQRYMNKSIFWLQTPVPNTEKNR
jgi:guanosine-3',5'-bis(diphosphate) 3'-pyrophosphohydrolase